MNYVYFTSEFLGSWTFAGSLVTHAPQHRMLAVVRCGKRLPLRQLLRLAEQSGFAYLLYLAAVLRPPQLPRAAFRALTRLTTKKRVVNSLQDFSATYGIPLSTVPNVNHPSVVSHLRDLCPDIVLSTFFAQKFGPAVLATPRFGCLNLHNSPLPSYAGVNPTIHALARGEKTFGVTLHYMTEAFDAGPIIAQSMISAHRRETVLGINRRLLELGFDMIVRALDNIATGQGCSCPQDMARRTYYSHPTKEQLRRFRRNGGRYFSWPEYTRLLFTGVTGPA